MAGVAALGSARCQEGGALKGIAIEPSLRPRARAMLDLPNGGLDIVSSLLRVADRDLSGACEPDGHSGKERVAGPEPDSGIDSLASPERDARLKLGPVRGDEVQRLLTRFLGEARTRQMLEVGRAACRRARTGWGLSTRRGATRTGQPGMPGEARRAAQACAWASGATTHGAPGRSVPSGLPPEKGAHFVAKLAGAGWGQPGP